MYHSKITNKVQIFSSIFCLLFMTSYSTDSEFFKSTIKLHTCSFNAVVSYKIFCYGIYVTNSSKMRMISWKIFLLPSMVKKMKMQMKPMHEIYHTLNKMGEMTYALFMLQLCCTGSIHTTSCSLEWSSLISLSRVERISSSSTRRLDFSISSMLTWLACNGAVYEENRAAE